MSNCSANVRPVQARSLSLGAGRSVVVSPPFQIYVEDTSAADATRYCWVTLYDSQVRECGLGR